jgi:6-phosphogluconolactonase (cycloisomerase 2 family)
LTRRRATVHNGAIIDKKAKIMTQIITLHQIEPTSLSIARFRGWGIVAALVFSIGTTHAQTSYVYVESNIGKTANVNSVFAFKNDGLGNLTALAGSPFQTGGTGVFDPGGGGFDPFNADQQVIAHPDNSLLFAVNGHSNTIAVFNINANGTLAAVAGSPFASGGQDPASVGLMQDLNAGLEFLLVVNKNEDPGQEIAGAVPNYTTFKVNADGSLTMNPGSTLDLTADSSPTQALVSSRGHLLFGMEINTSRIATYKIGRDGTLSEISSLSPPGTSPFLGEILHPTKGVLYTGLPATNDVGVYKFTSAGALTFRRTVPNAAGSLVCWLVTNAAGTRMYTSETESGTISVFDTTSAATPVLLQTLALSGVSQHPHNIALDPSGKFLYAQAGINLHVLNCAADGTMTETVSPVVLPEASDEQPIGLAAIQK